MPNIIKSNQTIITDIDREHESLGIDTTIPQTYTNGLAAGFKAGIRDVNNNVTALYNRYILELASGRELEEKAAEFGVTRTQGGLVSDNTYNNFNVFITNGLAEDFTLDTESPLVIPRVNVTISDSEGNEYVLNDDIVIEPKAATGFVPIQSLSETLGSVSINDIGTIRVFLDDNIINLDPTKAADIEFGCTNNKAIANSFSATSDDALRRLAFLRINSMNNTNEDAIRLVLARIGIDDIQFIRNHFGFGTIGIIVRTGGSSNISETSITAINNALANTVPGAYLIVPESIRTRFVVDIEFTDTTVSDDTKSDILLELENYFSTIQMGDPMDPTIISDNIRNLDNVENVIMRCTFLDDRKCISRKQFALSDQIFELDSTNPITYLST